MERISLENKKINSLSVNLNIFKRIYYFYFLTSKFNIIKNENIP